MKWKVCKNKIMMLNLIIIVMNHMKKVKTIFEIYLQLFYKNL